MQKNQHATCETAGQSVCHLIFNVLNLFLWGGKKLYLCVFPKLTGWYMDPSLFIETTLGALDSVPLKTEIFVFIPQTRNHLCFYCICFQEK